MKVHELCGKTLGDAKKMGYEYSGHMAYERGYISVKNEGGSEDDLNVFIGGRGYNKPYVYRRSSKSTQYKIRVYLIKK